MVGQRLIHIVIDIGIVLHNVTRNEQEHKQNGKHLFVFEHEAVYPF